METILINPDLLELVISNKKTTTCRLGKRNYPLGETILKSNASEDYTLINISKLSYYKLKDITNKMSKDNGFEDKGNLRKVLEGIYKGINNDSDVTIIHFNLIQDLV